MVFAAPQVGVGVAWSQAGPRSVNSQDRSGEVLTWAGGLGALRSLAASGDHLATIWGELG